MASSFRSVHNENPDAPKCKTKVVDGETLTKIIYALIEDLPNICLSKFKLCGGFQRNDFRASSGGSPQPIFPDFWKPMNSNETVEESENGNSTHWAHRHRRSAENDYSTGQKDYEGMVFDFAFLRIFLRVAQL